MSKRQIDEATAWNLIRALRGVLGEAAGAAEVLVGGAELGVDPSGEWAVSRTMSPEARELFELFLPVLLARDLVIGQMGQSLDGHIATESGHSHYVTGPADLRRLHRLRALVDAVVVGVGTVVADDPRLTVREVEGNNPWRVVLDPSGRMPDGCRLLTDGEAPTLLLQRRPRGEELPGVDRLEVAVPAGDPFPPDLVVRLLRERGLRRILVEGGGVTVSRFLRAGALDRLHVTVAPLLIGSGRQGIVPDRASTLDHALRPPCRTFQLGSDVLFDLDLSGDGSGA